MLGINSRLDTIQAYILNYKMNKFKDYLKKNRQNFKYFNKEFKNYLTLRNLIHNLILMVIYTHLRFQKS